MTNNLELEEVTSACTTPKELIKSADFMRWLDMVLSQAKTFNREYILSLFTKLQKDEVLGDEEKTELTKFVTDDKVAKLGQELLSKLSNVSVNVKTSNLNELWTFSDLLKSIFTEDWYNKVLNYVWEVADIAKLTLNTYEWMDEIVLNSLGWKKIYVKLFLEADDSMLTHELSNWAKSNFPESEITNNPELITKNIRWHYHFWHTASDNRLKELGMRSLTDEEMDSPELSRYIFVKLWNDRKNFPGYRSTNGNGFCRVEDYAFFWWGSDDKVTVSYVVFYSGYSKGFRYRGNRSHGLCLLGVKD